MTLFNKLRGHGFTTGMTHDQVTRLAGIATEVSFEEDEVILENGQRSEACFLLIAGNVAVELAARNITICVHVVEPNEIFGWSALLEDQATLFQVRARQASVAIRLDGALLSQAAREDAALGRELYHRTLLIAAQRMAATEQRLAELCGVRFEFGHRATRAGA